jgi:hypothetical protein
MSVRQDKINEIIKGINESFKDRSEPIRAKIVESESKFIHVTLIEFPFTFVIEVEKEYIYMRFSSPNRGGTLKCNRSAFVIETIERILGEAEDLNISPRNRMTYDAEIQKLLDDMGDSNSVKEILTRHYLKEAKELKLRVIAKNESTTNINALITQLELRRIDFDR